MGQSGQRCGRWGGGRRRGREGALPDAPGWLGFSRSWWGTPLVTGSWQVRLGSEILASEFTLPPSILLPEEPGAAEQRAGKKPVITKFMETGVRALPLVSVHGCGVHPVLLVDKSHPWYRTGNLRG